MYINLPKDLTNIIETYKNQLMFNEVIQEINTRINYENLMRELRFNNWKHYTSFCYYDFISANYYPHELRIKNRLLKRS